MLCAGRMIKERLEPWNDYISPYSYITAASNSVSLKKKPGNWLIFYFTVEMALVLCYNANRANGRCFMISSFSI